MYKNVTNAAGARAFRYHLTVRSPFYSYEAQLDITVCRDADSSEFEYSDQFLGTISQCRGYSSGLKERFWVLAEF